MLNAPSTLHAALTPLEMTQPTADVLTIRLCNYDNTTVDDTAKTWDYVIIR